MTRHNSLDTHVGGDVAIGWRILDVVIAIQRRLPAPPVSLRGYILMAPAGVLVGVLVVGLVILAVRSFHSFDPFLHQEGGLSLDNYRTLVEEPLFQRVFARTLMMAAITTL